ncbi:MAG: XamI family restriction endonuclease [Acidobacteria bacterium]|nr:XamI family restriction endonuclease [Acidobacteriota bacterium]
MSINADKPHLWKADIAASVDLFNTWFLEFAPRAYRETRLQTTKQVEELLLLTHDLTAITPEVLKEHPGILPMLRMTTCPPLARDRLIGLANANKSLVLTMESGRIAIRMSATALNENLERVCGTLTKMLDVDIFPWLEGKRTASTEERYRASTIVADRRCGAASDPIVRNAQEKRQLALIGDYLKKKGYKPKPHPVTEPLRDMTPGTYAFRMVVVAGEPHRVNIPVDVVIQPMKPSADKIPVLIEAKSAGDFTNVNKRRKEEATKIRQIRGTYGEKARFVLFLCGYFDSGYLGYEAAEGIDWIWEHRIEDLEKLRL